MIPSFCILKVNSKMQNFIHTITIYSKNQGVFWIYERLQYQDYSLQ